MKTITVQVTKEHIRKGMRRRAMKCPIALALLEMRVEHKGVSNVDVTFDTPSAFRPTYSTLPPEAVEWVDKFDELRYFRGCRIKPISFKLEVPDERP